MAIKGWSDGPRRIVRVGKIGLGYAEPAKNGGKKLIRADHFVVDKNVKKVYGEKPTELDICFPSDDFETVFPSALKRYSDKFGLICKGNGETARIPITYPFLEEYDIKQQGDSYIDSETGQKLTLVGENNKRYIEIPCAYRDCPMYQSKKCSEVGLLSVILYKVQGLGVYTLATKSYNSYQNIKAAFFHLKNILGRASFVPIKMQVRMEEKKPTIVMNGKLTQVTTQQPILHIVVEHSIEDMLQLVKSGQLMSALPKPLREDGSQLLIEPPDENEKPELLYPDDDSDGVIYDVDGDGNPMPIIEEVVSGGESAPVEFNPEPAPVANNTPTKNNPPQANQKASQNPTKDNENQQKMYHVRIVKPPANPVNTNIGGLPGPKFICPIERPAMRNGQKVVISGFMVMPANELNSQFVRSLEIGQVIKVSGKLLDNKDKGFHLFVENAPVQSVA